MQYNDYWEMNNVLQNPDGSYLILTKHDFFVFILVSSVQQVFIFKYDQLYTLLYVYFKKMIKDFWAKRRVNHKLKMDFFQSH